MLHMRAELTILDILTLLFNPLTLTLSSSMQSALCSPPISEACSTNAKRIEILKMMYQSKLRLYTKIYSQNQLAIMYILVYVGDPDVMSLILKIYSKVNYKYLIVF